MGIKGLWTVLTPYSEKKSLHELRGETLAVDLAGWVCDSQNVTDYYIQPKLYIRNLFFRTAFLILADISPIFVLEGDAPELKRDVMAARNAIQFCGAASKSDKPSNKLPSVARKRFKGVLKECENLLKSMGVRCIKGRGEAEATCARLNSQGVCINTSYLVDAVVSQDSDCFAYGAHRVYRNFSVSSSAGGGAMQGSVDYYDADKMFQDNGFGRNKMIALAILCGCDYGVGACGSAINTVLSFLHTVPEGQVISRLVRWVSEPEYYEERGRWAAAPGRCDRCGHVGRAHGKKGCPVCATHKGCDDIGHKLKVAEVKRELSLRNRALSSGMPFPEPKVMKEFLDGAPEDIDLIALKMPIPSLIQFVKIMTNKLDWSERYCVEKFLPLLTKWHLQDHVPCRTIKPIVIKKKRNPRGIPSYEVVWRDIDNQYDALIPDSQFEEDEDIRVPWTTTERQDLMRQFHPDLVESYEESIKKPPKEKKTKGRKKKDNQNKDNNENVKPKRKYTRKQKPKVKDSNKDVSVVSKPELNGSKALNVSVSINKLKRKIKNTPKSKSKNTIESYIVRKRARMSKSIQELDKSLKRLSLVTQKHENYDLNIDYDEYTSITDEDKYNAGLGSEKENVNCNNYIDTFDRTVEDSRESDLSDILDQIISKAPVVKTATVDSNLVKLVFNRNVTPSARERKSFLKNSSTPKNYILRKSLTRKYAQVDSEFMKNNCSTPKGSLLCKSVVHSSADNLFDSLLKKNTSNFFDKPSVDRDAFEISVENIHCSSIICID